MPLSLVLEIVSFYLVIHYVLFRPCHVSRNQVSSEHHVSAPETRSPLPARSFSAAPVPPGTAAAADEVGEGEQQQQRQADPEAGVEAGEVVPGRRRVGGVARRVDGDVGRLHAHPHIAARPQLW